MERLDGTLEDNHRTELRSVRSNGICSRTLGEWAPLERETYEEEINWTIGINELHSCGEQCLGKYDRGIGTTIELNMT